jgi:RimJ/RimL family protein N-acetyltransferase
MTIHSKRLDLILLTPAFIRAVLAHDMTTAEQLLGAKLPMDWTDCERLLILRLNQLEADPSLQPWLLRAMVRRTDRTMVGRISFHEAPDPEHYREIAPGAAEIGFEVFEPFRRQGYAHEASRALMQWANCEHRVSRFVVTIAPDNAASQALAAKLGFVRIGSHIDEIDGPEDILEFRVQATTAFELDNASGAT